MGNIFTFLLMQMVQKNYKVMKAAVNAPQMENWKEVLAHREDVLLEDLELLMSTGPLQKELTV